MSLQSFKVLQIDHLGVAVKDSSPISNFMSVLGIPQCGNEIVADQRVATTMFDANSVHVELLAATDDQSTIAKYIEKRGEGFHHIAFRVDNLQNALSALSEAGVQLIDQTPRKGAGGKLIAFLHPKSTGGILVELSQIDPEMDHR